jgi:hypothetical protein
LSRAASFAEPVSSVASRESIVNALPVVIVPSELLGQVPGGSHSNA